MKFGLGLAAAIAIATFLILALLPSRPLPPGCYYGNNGTRYLPEMICR